MSPPPAPIVEESGGLLLPALMDDIVEEILLRLPPAEPASLVNAALVCKRWCRIIAHRGFRRRFREVHRTPPMLGFLCNLVDGSAFAARFVPASASAPFPPSANHRGWRARDARHGRVLLHPYPYSGASFRLRVWDPITDERLELPKPPREPCSWSAAVLCSAAAAAATGACDHLDCHGGSFIVVFVGTGTKDMFACVYSSDAGAWSEPTYAKHPGDRISQTRSALVGNALYFVLPMKSRVLKYDLGTQRMCAIELPFTQRFGIMPSVPIQLAAMEDGRLGFARIEDSRLCLWTRDDGDEGWTPSRVMELEKLLPLNGSSTTGHDLVGFADGDRLVFVRVEDVIFTIDLKSSDMSKVYEGSRVTSVVPYLNFCTPGDIVHWCVEEF